jgi:signal transduction histidine kinase
MVSSTAAVSSPPENAVLPGSEVALRRLAATLGHNVNNPLTGVIGYLELGLREASPGSPLHDHLTNSLECAYQAAAAVKRIVTFAFRSQGAEGLAPLSLRAVAERAAEIARGLRVPGLTITVVGESSAWVHASDALVESALEQIVENAIEAMPAGGTLTFRVKDEGGRRCLSVCDTGGGMPTEVLAHLFEPFLTTKPSGHVGLGLVLCRDMIQAQGGTLTVVSFAGQGTTVSLSLPAVVAPSAALPDARPAPRLDPRQSTATKPPLSAAALARADYAI